MTALLELQGLAKRFGQVVVADGVDLTVRSGEAIGIVGPNGAGKSSLFAMISGDLPPDAGHIRFEGTDVTGMPAHRRCRDGIGRTYQVPRPFEKMTVFENVLVPATQGAGLRGQAAADRAAQVLGTAGLYNIANARAGSLSLLQRKRLEVARGLATSPKILLLDEVAGGLTDPEVHELVELISDVVHAHVKTVDRLLCLAGGRFVADGLPEDVLNDPAVLELYFGTGPDLAPANDKEALQ